MKIKMDFPMNEKMAEFYEYATKSGYNQAMIECILAASAEMNTRSKDFMKISKLQQFEALLEFKARNVSEIYLQWSCLSIVGNEDNRLYVRFHFEEFEKKQLNELSLCKNYIRLLGEASDDIWNEAQTIVGKRMNSQAQDKWLSTIKEMAIVNEINQNAGKLWVEKYMPRGYLELLSDEFINRSLLVWLKMWDKIVFYRQFRQEIELSNDQKSGASNFNKRIGRFGVDVRFRKQRLVQKIAVLCGSPGMNKTTSAHTIACHAGYMVREINVSDDRSSQSFRLVLQHGTEIQVTLLDQEMRLNCIILDEIDGALLTLIEFLMKSIHGQTKEAKKLKMSSAVDEEGKELKASGTFRRPIVCICNDIYTALLRSFRQVAFIVIYPPLDSGRFAKRMLSISRKKQLKIDMTKLMSFAEKSSNGVRSCISVQQFFTNSNTLFELADVMKSSIGQKDKQESMFQIHRFKEGFNLVQSKAIGANLDMNIQMLRTIDILMRLRVEHVLNVVHMSGDTDRLINGVCENYLSQKASGNFLSCVEANEWFCFTIQTQQNYSVHSYLTYGFVAWHFLFDGILWPKVTFLTQGFGYCQKSSIQKTIRGKLAKDLLVMVCSFENSATIIADAMIVVELVICSSMRLVTLLLLLKKRFDLSFTVDVMSNLGSTYLETKNSEEIYQHDIEANINSSCNSKEWQ